MTAFPEMHRGG